MIIDCGSCAVAGLACSDCVVTVLLGMPEVLPAGMADPAASGVPELPEEHVAAVAALAASGLVPPLRLVPGSKAS
ncbi:MAG TPA: hypothetical protein DCQ36_07630 [Actinobacteria bacterium]|jgi:hypothetical protein|nr:hypothetical protein [Actinomycetota bacterium]